MKILITGGPVHAKLDAVKIITNKFRGGLMAELAELLLYNDGKGGIEVTYLTAKGAKLPTTPGISNGRHEVAAATIIYHDGFHDYHKKVLELAPKYDAVVLGAAVANLIPLSPLEGKFPSHNFKPGDVIPINFTIAPRVIDDVKNAAPNSHLFGFKLLSGVAHDELIKAAYGVLLESHATAVFANDATNLLKKYTVTKERGVHEMNLDSMSKFIIQCVQDTYYKTVLCTKFEPYDDSQARHDFGLLAEKYNNWFKPIPEGYVFGTIAVKNPDGSFLTTGRGKNELNDTATVYMVDHENHTVEVHCERKASLNAPLLDWVFKHNPKVYAIVHYHQENSALPTYPYAIPGTVRDSQRKATKSFNIANHGSFWLLDAALQII